MIWSDNEKAVLRTQYGKLPNKKLAEQLGRSTMAVSRMAERLSLQQKHSPAWTPEEDLLLIQLHPTMEMTHIAKVLGRTVSAISTQAVRLGLRQKNSSAWTRAEEQQLLQLYPTMKTAQLAKIMGRTVAAISMRAHHLKDASCKKRRPKKLSIGDERLNSHGLLVRKMTDTGNQWRDWKRVDVIDWEAINGPVPPGKVLARVNPYLPRSPSNMALFSKEELSAHFTGMHAPPEMRELMSLKRQILKELAKTPVQKASSAPAQD